MTVRIEDEGPVRTVTVDRPECRNAVDPDTAKALRVAFCESEAGARRFTGGKGRGGRFL